jgi:hypothetical protein
MKFFTAAIAALSAGSAFAAPLLANSCKDCDAPAVATPCKTITGAIIHPTNVPDLSTGGSGVQTPGADVDVGVNVDVDVKVDVVVVVTAVVDVVVKVEALVEADLELLGESSP